MIGPLLLSQAFWTYPHWWVEVRMRVRAAVLAGQTDQRRLVRTPPGEVVARAMDADRIARYTDRWVDFVNGLLVAALTAAIAGTWLAGAVLLAVMTASALASSLGRRVAGRSAAAASTARAGFGQALVSTLESIRTVKLAAATPHLHRHLREVDGGRVDAAVREHRVQSLLDGVPVVMVQCGVVAAWAGLLTGHWELATALLVANAVSGFDWFGRVAGAVVTEAPGTRAWMDATSALAGGGDLMVLPAGMDLSAGTADAPARPSASRCARSPSRDLSAVHDDGTLGVQDVDLDGRRRRARAAARPGRLRQVQPARRAGRAGQQHRRDPLERPRSSPTRRRPCDRRRVAHVAQVPRVLSGTFTGNVGLDHPEPLGDAGARDLADGSRRRPRPAAPTRSSATAAYASPAARCSASRWRGRWRPRPTCCSPTTSRRRSTRRPRSSCGRRCASAAPP